MGSGLVLALARLGPGMDSLMTHFRVPADSEAGKRFFNVLTCAAGRDCVLKRSSALSSSRVEGKVDSCDPTDALETKA
jgi:hypothetical protein